MRVDKSFVPNRCVYGALASKKCLLTIDKR